MSGLIELFNFKQNKLFAQPVFDCQEKLSQVPPAELNIHSQKSPGFTGLAYAPGERCSPETKRKTWMAELRAKKGS